MVLVCKAQASTWWLDTLLVCLASGQVFTSIWSCLLPVFWDPLLANTKSGIDTKDINLLRQIKKHPSASTPSFSKNHFLAMFSLGLSHCNHRSQTLQFLPQMFPLEHLPLPRAKGELETSQNRHLGNFVGSAPDFWLHSVSQSQGRNRKAGWKLDSTRIRSSGSCGRCNTQY